MNKDEIAIREYVILKKKEFMGEKTKSVLSWYRSKEVNDPAYVLELKYKKEKLASKTNKALDIYSTVDKDDIKLELKKETDELRSKIKQDVTIKKEIKNIRQKEEQEYLDKLIELHEIKMKTYIEQKKNAKLVPSEKDIVYMIMLQKEINNGKAKYENEFGKEALEELINKNFKDENIEKKAILEEHQIKINDFEKLNEKLDEIVKKIASLETARIENRISESDYNNSKEYYNLEKLDTIWDINQMDPAMLAREEKEFAENEKLADTVLGANYKTEFQNSLDQTNYHQSKIESATIKEQDGSIIENKQQTEEIHEEEQKNIEENIEKIKTDISREESAEAVVVLAEQLGNLEKDKEVSEKQEKVVEGPKDIQTQEIQQEETNKKQNSNELEEAMTDFQKNIMEIEDLEKGINNSEKVKSQGDEKGVLRVFENFEGNTETIASTEQPSSQESTGFVNELKNLTIDINEDSAAEEYLNNIQQLNERATQYKEELLQID